jgi:hypothetical protein
MLEELKRRGGYQADIEADVAELAADIRRVAPQVAAVQLASVHAMLNFMAPVEALLKRIRSDEGAVFRKMKVGRLVVRWWQVHGVQVHGTRC